MYADFWILKPFNPMFFICTALAALLGFVMIRVNRKKDEAQRRRAVVILYAAALALFFVYKITLNFDREYDEILAQAGQVGFNFMDELPLNLCNINLILIIIGLEKRARPILGFTFFFGTLGALMALTMPCAGFDCYNLFLPRMLGYYVTHFIIALQLPLLAGLDLYRPKFRDILPAFGTLLLLAACMTGVNHLFRTCGISPTSNYFFSYDPNGNFILELFYSWLPYPGLYLLPGTAIVLPYMAAVTAVSRLLHRRDEKTDGCAA
ncbi:MAG: YwaF family protein [Clostridia bacterium]|nr:YwaF family protein [Clostridia bacterium]